MQGSRRRLGPSVLLADAPSVGGALGCSGLAPADSPGSSSTIAQAVVNSDGTVTVTVTGPTLLISRRRRLDHPPHLRPRGGGNLIT